MSFTGWQKAAMKTPTGGKQGIAPVIISASRATDIPALYPEWFMHRLTQGYIKWINRFNGQPAYGQVRAIGTEACFQKSKDK
ncbi:MAG TPA: DUF1848 family protein [Thermodesulfovibrionales bacterium]|nr:DUF1848 family protein [Thermodesulfovibrionales bacterium]